MAWDFIMLHYHLKTLSKHPLGQEILLGRAHNGGNLSTVTN